MEFQQLALRGGNCGSARLPDGLHIYAVAAKGFCAVEGFVGSADQRFKRQIVGRLQAGGPLLRVDSPFSI